jgi:4-amino-4-deoxy-L-arabinose transferase-like glycosyltransferase
MAIAVPWYLTMLSQHGRVFTDFAIGHEIVERVMSETAFAPTRSFTFYFQVWPGDAAPWSLMFVVAAIWAGVRWRSIDAEARRAIVFALAWFLTIFVVFTLSRTKIPHYVLPAYPAAALLIGVFVDRVAAADRHQAWWWRIPMLVIAAAALATAALLNWSMALLMPGASIEATLLVPVILGVGALALVVAVWRSSPIDAVSFLAITLTMAFAAIGGLLVPHIVEHFKPMPALAAHAARIAPPGTPIGLLGRYGASSLIYYSRHNVKWLLDDDEAVAFLATPATVVAVMPESDFARLALRLPGTRVVASAEEFNVRLSRLIERRHTPGRQWVLVATRQ